MNRDIELRKLGEKIRDARIGKHLTQHELAIVCELNRNYIGMLERGERNPTYITLLRIAQHLRISLSSLITCGGDDGCRKDN